MFVITGTPGTGKTTIAKLIAKRLELPLIEVNKLVKQKKLYTGTEGGSLVVDMAKLKKELRGFDGVVEGHVLCELKLPATALVFRASPLALRKRLAPRKYPKQKVLDNLEAEALDYCAIKATENYSRIIQIDTTGLTPAKSTSIALNYLKRGGSDFVDWSEYFLSVRV